MREIGDVFVDENLLPVGRALDEVGNALYPGHPDVPRFPTGASDVAIFDEVGANGRDLVLFTRDNRIRRRSSELYRFRQAGVRAVILTGKSNLKPRENLLLILSNWDNSLEAGVVAGTGTVGHRPSHRHRTDNNPAPRSRLTCTGHESIVSTPKPTTCSPLQPANTPTASFIARSREAARLVKWM